MDFPIEMERNKSGLCLPLFRKESKRSLNVVKVGSMEYGCRRPTPISPISPLNEEQNVRLISPPEESDGSIPPIKPGVDYINIGQEEQSEVYGYRRSSVKTFVTWIFILLTGGFLRLIFHWAPQLMLKATHTRCSLQEATRVLVIEQYKNYERHFVKDVKVLSADRLSWDFHFHLKGFLHCVQQLISCILFVFDASYDSEYSALRGGVSVDAKGNRDEEKKDVSEDKPKSIIEPSFLVVPTMSGQLKDVSEIRWFTCKKMSYIWDQDSESFYRLSGLDNGQTLADLHSYRGLSWIEQLRRRVVYGENTIKVPVQPIWKLLFLEALNPFYIFQVFSVCLWYADQYMYYATVIVITSVTSIISEVYQMHKNQVSLSSTILSSDVVEILRDTGEIESVPSEHLVPGDVMVIPPQGCMMQCDAVLLQGNAIVNESMLTGESVPVTKTPLLNRKDQVFKEKEHSRHILFNGTHVIQTRFYGNEKVTAVIIRSGFMTSKGSLVRSIMYPPPVDFKFQQDAYRFILFLVGVASVGFIYTVVNKIQQGHSPRSIALDSLDLITIVVPPALPMAMTVGILYALQRLKMSKIFCISPRAINISGVLNCICFDKTGTLTEDGLDMKGVVGVSPLGSKSFLGKMVQASSLPRDHFLFGMAACHSITIINMNLVGDPLDLKMFESTSWILEEPGNDDTSKYDMIMPSIVRPSSQSGEMNEMGESSLEVGILRQFPFSSTLQRMSVITRKIDDPSFTLYSKGSPEMIMSLSKPETVPSNFAEVLLGYTQKGFRVLALGWKPLKLSYTKVQVISREEVETDLIFLGLLVLENRLKVETTPAIQQLHNANIRTVMVTGDCMLTALSVGRECGLVTSNQEVIYVKAVKSHDELQTPYSIKFESAGGSISKKECLDTKSRAVSLNVDDWKYCFATEGNSWAVIHSHFPELLEKLAVRGAVFARMNPDQKQQLVMTLQSLGYYVGMCGDGANDCGALKSSHASISLSEAEASIASPFTSKEPNISCVLTLIREGRTALTTSFGVFKYMAAYSLTQFVSVMILYSINSGLTDLEFLYIDLFLITIFVFFYGRTLSYEGPLSPHPPASSLISLAPIASILLHVMLVIGFQTFTFFYVQQQPWFVPFNATEEAELGCYENYAVYSISQFQYIILAVVFAKGPPYRQPIYTNYLLMGSIIVMTIFSIYLTVAPVTGLANVLEIILPPEDGQNALFFRWQIIIFAIVNSIIAIGMEYFIVDYLIQVKLQDLISNPTKSKKKYLTIEIEMKRNYKWPIISDNTVENDIEMSLNHQNYYANSTITEVKENNGYISLAQCQSFL